MSIPKIIHQTIADKRDMHPLLQQNIEKIKVLNPDHEYRLYDDVDIFEFIKKYYDDEIMVCFQRINPKYGAARADFFRYLLMYKIGGVYLDIKSTMDQPLNQVLLPTDAYILSHWRNEPGQMFQGWGMHHGCGLRGEYQQWHIISEPDHDFLKHVIRKIIKNINEYDINTDKNGKVGVLYTTGPVPYTEAIKEIEASHEYRLVDIYDLGFRYSAAGNQAEHQIFFENHYSAVSEPIILPRQGQTELSARKSDSVDHKQVFNQIYLENRWNYGSGPGSTPENTIEYRKFLQNYLQTNQIKSVLDIGCGDWQFSRHMDWTWIKYIGIDVSDVVLANTRQFSTSGIEFHELNALTDELPYADLLIMKDVIQHWSNDDILNFIPKIKKFDRCLITNGFPDHALVNLNIDIRPGDYRSVNLNLEPFNLKGSFVFWFLAEEPKYVYCWNRGE